ncbi:Blp family class II bacteriocin [Thalassotalea mangrovi]|uniref:Bacteriocin n=1 Tax=Thalassotalea mangrovi TaxID=2572245 RepID=A0A4U1B4N5_9GAMM|nr:Blp family class II bacteriocin [Thalassotalea mangrovi]TKB45126.1 bacteriocin [Thalassotalea mangrovi]
MRELNTNELNHVSGGTDAGDIAIATGGSWAATVAGFAIGGPVGAVAGFALGTLISVGYTLATD